MLLRSVPRDPGTTFSSASTTNNLVGNQLRRLVWQRSSITARPFTAKRTIYYSWTPQLNGRHSKHRGIYRWIAALTVTFLLGYLTRPRGGGSGGQGQETAKTGEIHGMKIRRLPIPAGIYMKV